MIWWWQFTCKEVCTPEPITNLGCDVKNKSVQENDVSKKCARSLIIWFKPFFEVNMSVFAPSKLVLSLMHQLYDCALRSPNIEKLCAAILFKFQWHIVKFWKESSFGPGLASVPLLKISLCYDTTKNGVMLLKDKNKVHLFPNKEVHRYASWKKKNKVAKLFEIAVWKSVSCHLISEIWTYSILRAR